MSFVQTKTSQGFIPFRGVMLRDDGVLEFDVLSARELMSAEPSRRAMMSSPAATKDLIDLALCSPSAESSDAQRAESMLYAFAQWSGPLFGSSHIESLRAWKYAADVAMLATRLQECANGLKPISSLKALGRVHKQRVIDSVAGVGFDELDVAIAVCGDYRDVVSTRPMIRRTEDADGICYVSVARHDEADLTYLEFVAIRLAEDMDASDLQELMEDAGIADGKEALATFAVEPDRYVFEDSELCAEDLPAIAALLRAIVPAHLDGVHVDAFADYDATGNLSFVRAFWHGFGTTSLDASAGCQSDTASNAESRFRWSDIAGPSDGIAPGSARPTRRTLGQGRIGRHRDGCFSRGQALQRSCGSCIRPWRPTARLPVCVRTYPNGLS